MIFLFPVVSIVIPVYNSAPYLDSCLNSVVKQTYQSFEVIIINDGSTDNSEEIIKRYEKSDKRFKLFSQENHGLGYTRNKGIHLSKGKYIFFLDSDDLIPHNAIELLVNAIEKNNADYAVGKVVRFNNNRKYIPIRHLEFNLYKENTLTNIMKNPELLQDSIACNKLWKKDLLIENDLYFREGKYYEDLFLTLKAAVLAQNIEVISDIVYLWRVRDDENKPSITQQQMRLENTLDRLSALENNRKWLINKGVDCKIIKEHDLKSLLDVLRLHVLKYALVREEERDQWIRSVISFLNQIPLEVVDKLPDMEKCLYTLLMNNNLLDLKLFSLMLTNTENSPIVTQTKTKFILNGNNKKYEVTHFLKPTMIVTNIKRKGWEWHLYGHLTVPKASNKIEGKLNIISRIDNQLLFTVEVHSKPTEKNSCYPYERQIFNFKLSPDILLKVTKKSVFDVFFCLNAYPNYRWARVRLDSNIKGFYNIHKGFKIVSLYSTHYGNLSIKIQRIKITKFLAKKIKVLYKKYILKN